MCEPIDIHNAASSGLSRAGRPNPAAVAQTFKSVLVVTDTPIPQRLAVHAGKCVGDGQHMRRESNLPADQYTALLGLALIIFALLSFLI
ncbi:MAG: hypothetical protein P8Y67_05065 [Alphaproteobacteria bacterium]